MGQLIIGSTLFALGAIILLQLVQCVQSEGEDEIWLIPDGFTGHLVLIEDRKEGEPPKYEDGKRVYEFPKSGILKTQFEANTGWKKEIHYYITDQGKRNELLMRTPKNMEIIKDGEAYLTEGGTSFPMPFPYSRFFSRAVLRKGFEEEIKKIDLNELLLSYARKNNDI